MSLENKNFFFSYNSPDWIKKRYEEKTEAMNELYVPPDFMHSYLLPYLTALLDAELTDATEIYEFSARYFDEKVKERNGKEGRNTNIIVSQVPSLDQTDQTQPDFSYDSVMEMYPKKHKEQFKLEDKMKKKIPLQWEKEHSTKSDVSSTIKKNLTKSSEDEQRKTKPKLLPKQESQEIQVQLNEFSQLLPEYISVMADLMESLGEKCEIVLEKACKDKYSVPSEQVSDNIKEQLEKTITEKKESNDAATQTSFIADDTCESKYGKVQPYEPFEEQCKHPDNLQVDQTTYLVPEIEFDMQPVFFQEMGKAKPHQKRNGFTYNSKRSESFRDRKMQQDMVAYDIIKNANEKEMQESINHILNSYQKKNRFYPSDMVQNLKDLTRNLEFALEANGYASDTESLANASSSFNSHKNIYISDKTKESKSLNQIYSIKDLPQDFSADLPEADLTSHLAENKLPLKQNTINSVFRPPKYLGRAIKKDKIQQGSFSKAERNSFRTTIEMQKRLHQIKTIQYIKNLEKLAKGNGTRLRNCDKQDIGVPITGRCWLRTLLTIQFIKDIKEDDWKTLYVKGEDDDLGLPLTTVHYINNEVSNFFTWLGFFKAFRIWYFSKRIRAFQKDLDSKK